MVVRFSENGRKVQGSLTGTGADSFTVILKSGFRTFAVGDVDELSYGAGKKSEPVTGALVGAAIGAVTMGAALLLENAMAESMWGEGAGVSGNAWAQVGAGAAAGAALGAIMAVAFPQERWVAVQVPRVEPVVSPSGNGVAIGMRVRF
jgi:hypothetical protein